MSGRQILFHDDARHQIAAGLDALADAVQVTLGPRGRNVLIERSWGAPEATKDGVTVAREVELTDRFANLGAQMVKEVAARTAELAGDGTTTATVLARAIYTAGARLVAAGIDPMELKRGIDAAVEVVVGELARQSIATQGGPEIAQVGIISANGDTTIGNLIALAMEKVGRDGAITIEEATSIETTLDVVVGMQLDRGYLSPYFVTDADRMEAVLTDAYILVVEQRLASMQELLPVLELVAQAGKPLLIVAEDVEREALATLVVNRLRGTLQVCAIKAPGYGDRRRAQLEDLATLTGGQAITADLGRRLEEVTLAELGRARTITIDKDRTTIVEGRGEPDAIAARVRTLRVAIAEADAGPEREALAQRLARLSGGVAVIKVGAASESELKEKKARVDDALHATRAAVEEGIVAGGGVALLRTLPALAGLQVTGDRRHGVAIIARAIEEPLRQIARNSNAEPAVVVARVVAGSGPFGYDAAHDRYTDLIAAGIIDPTKVVRVALQNAASVAGLMLTTEAAIAAGPAPSDRDR